MTTQRRSPRRRRTSTARRPTMWVNYALGFVLTAPTGPLVVADLTPEPVATQVGGVNVGQATILRLIMDWTFTSPVSDVNPQHAGVGIYVITEDAFDQLAFADPLGTPQISYYYFHFATLNNSGAAQSPQTWSADIRTKRRLRTGWRLVIVANNPTNDVATELNLSARGLWTIS